MTEDLVAAFCVGFLLGLAVCAWCSRPLWTRRQPLDDFLASRLEPGIRLDSSRQAAVDGGYHWRPMESCPRGVKVQLLGAGGVASYGSWDGKNDFWRGWAPLPKVRK